VVEVRPDRSQSFDGAAHDGGMSGRRGDRGRGTVPLQETAGSVARAEVQSASIVWDW
jgi:hypothetical protein